MRRIVFRTLFLALAAALVALAPNGLWLSRSSALVRNAAAEPVALRITLTGQPGQVRQLDLAPGASRFLWIDPVGEATLTAEVFDGVAWRLHCREYVEAGMYRVEITVRARDDVSCSTGLALLNRLLLLDLLS